MIRHPLCLLGLIALSARADVVINEIHYDPAPANDPVAFIELHNSAAQPVDLSNWRFSKGIGFVFAPGAKIEANGYLVLAAHLEKYNERFSSTAGPAFGQFLGQLAGGGEALVLVDSKGLVVDEVDYRDRFPWPAAASETGSSMELIHPKLDNSLGGNWRTSVGAKPTPGAKNSVYSEAAGPAIRQIEHAPKAPKPGEAVVVSAKVTDPEGLVNVSLHYQLVEPGKYIHLKDPSYETQWTSLAMQDDGKNGDAVAGDSIYTATMPGELQKHRHLLRYRIVADDKSGNSTQVPYSDDGQPNFAYFCYGQMPGWKGAVKAGDPEVEYSSELLQAVPVYQFLTTRQHHVDAQFNPDSTLRNGDTGAIYKWGGTLVYDGEVYDHIKFRARGGVWRYAMGKNMWKFLFNRGREFQARDQQGEKYPEDWRRLNFSSIIQQGDFQHRGEQGLFESVGFELFNKAGVAAPRTHYVHFRIIENAEEAGTGTQYGTDFQGLYLAVEQIDGRFLKAHGLPKGNIYKMEGGTGLRGLGGELKTLGPYPAVSNSTDLEAFKKAYEKSSPKPTQEWWEQNLELDSYYNYRAIVDTIHHYDIGDGKNYFFYLNSETNKWRTLPWDLDLTFADNMYGSGAEPFKSRVINASPFKIAFENRFRELRDLLCNEEQVGMLISEKAATVYTSGKPSLVDADRAMWDYNPILKSKYVNSSKAGHGLYYKKAATKDFPGMMKIMRDYIIKRSKTPVLPETDIPATPSVAHVSPSYFLDDLRFETSDFAAGSGSVQEFAGMSWRLAEVTDPKDPNFDPAYPNSYEIDAVWQSGELKEFQKTVTIPASAVKPDRTYRVRVRMKNNLGYWGHWSAPLQFVPKTPDLQPYKDGLAISEIMYAPVPASQEEIAKGYSDADFEYIELANLAGTSLDLTHLRFTKGIEYDFAKASTKTLAAGQRGLLVRNLAAFTSRHGSGMLVLGAYGEGDGNKLDDKGEELKLSYGGGVPIRTLEFLSEKPWPTLEPGHSLQLTPGNTIPDHALPTSWQASAKLGGSPGTGETAVPGLSYSAWSASRFDAAQLANAEISGPLADPDRDGWKNAFEFLLLGNPLSPDVLGPSFRDGATADSLNATLRVRDNLSEASWQWQTSVDLKLWEPTTEATAKLLSSTAGADGSRVLVYECPRRSTRAFRFSIQLGQ